MNKWSGFHREAETYKKMYPSGTRIVLLHMGKDPMPVENLMRGTVVHVDDIGTVHCIFDNGRKLGMISGEDHFRKLTAKELLEEQRDSSSLESVMTNAACRSEKTCSLLSHQAAPEVDNR